ncbi:MAG: LPS export ABC transporter periplasmic protein LptC [Myxococcota bacterium]
MGTTRPAIARRLHAGSGVGRAVGVVLLLLLASVGAAEAPDLHWLDGDPGQILHVVGMTFVASEGSENEVLLRAERARFYPDHQVADLEGVEVTVAPGPGRTGFEMRCESGRLNLATQSFVAEGSVSGTIEGGRRFRASWVAYDDDTRVLYTDEPVVIIDRGGSYRGGGFRYFVDEQRFRLEGGASVVQEP